MSYAYQFYDGLDALGRTGFRPLVAGVEDERSALIASGLFTAVLAWGLTQVTAGVTCTVVEPLAGSGYALRVEWTGHVDLFGVGAGGISKTLPGDFSRLGVQLDVRVNLDARVRQGIVFGDTGVDQFALTIESSGQLGVRKGNGTAGDSALYGVLVATSAEAIPTGASVHLDLDVTIGGSGHVKAYIDGVATSLDATVDTQATANATANELRFAATGSNAISSSYIEIDNLFIRGNPSGAPLLINPIVETHFPTGDYSIDFAFGAGVLGDDAPRTTATNSPGAGQLVLRRFTPDVDCTLDSITFLPEATSATAKFKVAAYADNAGAPGARLSDGVEVVGCTDGVEKTGDLVTPQALTAGTPVWLALYGDTAISLRLADDELNGCKLANAYGGGAAASAAAATATQVDWLLFGSVSGVASDFWSVVDDNPFSSDWSYMTSSTPGDADRFTFPNLYSTPTTIISVGVKGLLWRADAGARTASLLTKSAASESTGSASGFGLNLTATLVESYWDLDPDTAAAWNASGVNNAKHGYQIG